MAKSSETYNKKEKEKKRSKKQQEKKEKAEVRKANSSKGKDLDDMMAYVDENGNITATRPAFIKPKPIEADDIQIATPKKSDEPDELNTGVIAFFNTSKGYGFIRDGRSGQNIFVHINSLSFEAKENDKVSFEVEQGLKGPNAVRVKKI